MPPVCSTFSPAVCTIHVSDCGIIDKWKYFHILEYVTVASNCGVLYHSTPGNKFDEQADLGPPPKFLLHRGTLPTAAVLNGVSLTALLQTPDSMKRCSLQHRLFWFASHHHRSKHPHHYSDYPANNCSCQSTVSSFPLLVLLCSCSDFHVVRISASPSTSFYAVSQVQTLELRHCTYKQLWQ